MDKELLKIAALILGLIAFLVGVIVLRPLTPCKDTLLSPHGGCGADNSCSHPRHAMEQTTDGTWRCRCQTTEES
jgi:hypothetical protein